MLTQERIRTLSAKIKVCMGYRVSDRYTCYHMMHTTTECKGEHQHSGDIKWIRRY